jgi:DNA-directed RNA polymerase specialized sigma24 family protein
MSTSIMTEPMNAKGILQYLSDDRSELPSGMMQVVLMHALQLRQSPREVFLLCDLQGHSISEAATILGISRSVAHRRLRFARQRMKEVVERLCGPAQDKACS